MVPELQSPSTFPFTHWEFDRLTCSDSRSSSHGASYKSNGYTNGYSKGGSYDSYPSAGDKMADIGSNLKKPIFDLSALPKFEKNFYREADSVKNRSERQVEEFRNRKEIRVSGKHIPRPVETFEEAGFPCISLTSSAKLTFSIRSQRVELPWIQRTYSHSISGLAYGLVWSGRRRYCGNWFR